MSSSRPLPDAPESSWFSGNPLIHAILIAVVCLLSYSNTFHVPFQLDDPLNISEKPYVRDLSAFFEPAKIEEYRSDWPFRMRMVGFFTLAINYRLHGDDVVGYHIVNLVIHILNGLLVYFLLLLTFRTPYFSNPPIPPLSKGGESTPHTVPPLRVRGGEEGLLIALFVALLFACHPIQTQAVTYIVQRFTSLATLFFLLSLVMYIKWRLSSDENNPPIPLLSKGVESKPQTLPPLRVRGPACPVGRGEEGLLEEEGGFRRDTSLIRFERFSLYAVSLIFAVLAMKTKEIAFTLPVIIALYEFMFFTGPAKKRLLYLVPFLLTMLIIPLELMGLEVPAGEIIGDVIKSMKVQTDISRWDYLFTQFRVIVTYIRLLFFPVNQNLDYDYPVYHTFFDPNVFLSFLLLLVLFGTGVYLLYRSRVTPQSPPYLSGGKKGTLVKGENDFREGQWGVVPPLKVRGGEEGLPAVYFRLISFGIFWFFITLSVESSVIPIVDVIFEHRLYLPSVGFFIAVTAALFMAWERLRGKAQWAGKAAAGVLLAAVILFSGATYARNTVWQSQLSLWSDVVQKSPRKVRALSNFGLALMDKGDADRAADAYARAIALDPNIAEPHYNMGKVYEKKGLHDKAIEEYRKAVSLRPDFADAFFDLGVAYAAKGMRDEAVMNYKIALRLKPDYAEAHFNLGVNYLSANLLKEARDEFEAALRLDPAMDQARLFLEYINRMQ